MFHGKIHYEWPFSTAILTSPDSPSPPWHIRQDVAGARLHGITGHQRQGLTHQVADLWQGAIRAESWDLQGDGTWR